MSDLDDWTLEFDYVKMPCTGRSLEDAERAQLEWMDANTEGYVYKGVAYPGRSENGIKLNSGDKPTSPGHKQKARQTD